MTVFLYPDLAQADALLARPAGDWTPFREKAAAMLAAIRKEGDAAALRFARQFDRLTTENIAVTPPEIEAAESVLSHELKQAIRQAYANIRRFHEAQRETFYPLETMPGVVCWRRSLPIERVGLYVPGGTAPLFSTVLMLGVPAQLAGCQEIILCSPPQAGGAVHPAVLFAASLCGIRKVFKLGGVQAIGAMAYGTETVPQVWKIFGPGNPWVTAAKQLVSLDGVAIDLPAGPSELAVVADASANPVFVAADLLSQAEHGPDSQVLLVSDDAALLENVQTALAQQLSVLPRREFAAAALQNSRALLVENLETALAWTNAYAPEHLILHVQEPEAWATQVTNAGSVFLGGMTPESAGDYASGTNHTLPTGGAARAFSGVSLDSFFKKITFQQISPAGLRGLGPTVVEMARAEGLEAHARAVTLRLLEQTGAQTAPESRLLELVRPNIRTLKPYRSARDEAELPVGTTDAIFLDANENSLGGPGVAALSRYPDPHQQALKTDLAAQRGLDPAQIFLGNGSDEAIDLLLRAFCEPGRDNVVLLPPTYGMYAVLANIHGVEIRKAPLRPDFSPDAAAVYATTDGLSKLLFLCSPNNPTGNCLPEAFILDMLANFPGLVVVDEAYADFSGKTSWAGRLREFPNLVVLQTFSKAWGLAGLRVGMAFANPLIIDVLNKIKYPYNLNLPAIQQAQEALQNEAVVRENVAVLLAERARLAAALSGLACVQKVFPSDANFLLVQTTDADAIYRYLCQNGIVVRNRSRELHCENCLRITVGTPEQNDRLLAFFHT